MSEKWIALPLSSGVCVLPGTPVRVTSRSSAACSMPKLLLHIEDDWVVSDVEVDRRSVLGVARAIDVDSICAGADVSVTATYVGASPEGAPLKACLIGVAS